MLLSLLVSVAVAVPQPLLGPDGPVWIGPLPPAAQDGRSGQRRSVITIDPSTGDLDVEERDASGVFRVWDGRRWMVDGAGVTDDWPIRRGFSLVMDGDGVIESATSADGVVRRYRYDSDGRLEGISWGDGSRLNVQYDSDGRVVETRGPGAHVVRLSWGRALKVDRTPGGLLTVRTLSTGQGGSRTIEVADGAGRVARTWLERSGGRERIVAWEGPRGLRTVLDWDDRRLTVEAAGRSWVVRVDEDERPLAVTMPSGGTWSWTWDRDGRAVEQRDPTGRGEGWHRDEAGRVTEVNRGGRVVRLERDLAGRINVIVSPSGGRTVLERNASGYVTAIVDASGNPVQLTRGPGGRLDEVVGRGGGKWAFSSDGLGRINRIKDPSNHDRVLTRDASGRVVKLDSRRYGITRIRRGADGQISRVEAPDGRVTGFIRDAHGRATAVLRADGTRLTLERDAAGELKWAAIGSRGVEVERAPSGLPLRAGPVRWRRDGNGNVSRIVAPGVDVALERDLAGRLWGARAGSWVVGVQHDAAGLPIAWRGSDGDLLVQRDATGGVVIEETRGQNLRISRDPRGYIQRLALGDRTWRITRDATGRPLTLQGPDDLRAGLDWDAAGRLSLVRYPGGALLRRAYERDIEHIDVVGPGGKELVRRSIGVGADGQVTWSQEDEQDRSAWRYDPTGQLVAIERSAGAWSWAPGFVEGPLGQLQVLNERGDLTEARVTSSLPAWGVADRLVTAFRAPDGTLTGVTGDLGVADLRHDALGRLVEVVAAGQRWRLEWDAVGRLAALVDPTGAKRVVRWWPGRPGSSENLLLVGKDQPWLPGAPNALAVHTPGGAEAVVHVGGDPRWLLDAFGRPLEILTTPMGLPDSGAGRLAGAGGTIQVFAGGPLLDGDVALDPVSGHPTTGKVQWPWQATTPRGPSSRVHLDPGLWAPMSPWHDPLSILVSLGEISPVVQGEWVAGPGAAVALPWLPSSLDGGTSPLGPPKWSLPLEEEPLVNDLIAAMLPGAPPLDADFFLRAVVSREPDMDLSGELPPGVAIPGLVGWGSDPNRSAESRYLPLAGQ